MSLRYQSLSCYKTSIVAHGTVRGRGDVDVQSTFSEAFTEGGMSMDVDV